MARTNDRPACRHLKIAIVGAGFSGIGMAVQLRRAGVSDFVIFERALEYGGVWQHNSYPGAACDIPSYLYSFSFAQRKGWSRPCSPQAEILEYLHDVARESGVDDKVRCGIEIVSATYDEVALEWMLASADGDVYVCDVLIVACGQLSRPATPLLPGLEQFRGRIFHSASWDHELELADRRIAVVGTGASAIQFVPPVAELAAHLDVYQRTAPWLLPRRNPAYRRWFRWLNDRVPGVQHVRRAGMWMLSELMTAAFIRLPAIRWLMQACAGAFMRSQVRDPDLRAKIWPAYPLGCKRVLFSSYYLPALQRPNVELITEAIDRVTDTAIVTSDGVERATDVIVFGTGFRANEFVAPMLVSGRNGLTLDEAWAGGAQAHHGISVSGFPNMFLLYGPNTNLGSGSVIMMIEAQIGYALGAVRELARSNSGALEVKPEVQRGSSAAVQERLRHTVWMGCNSWYRVNETGRITNNWPGQIYEYGRLVRNFDAESYVWIGGRPPTEPTHRFGDTVANRCQTNG
jgi:cation diffusion facilitator CzcD-associated flavoprotein CzcO